MLVRDYAGLSVGYGFVEFDSPAHADELVRLMAENWVIKDKKISLQISNGKIKPKSYYRGPPSRTIVLKPLPPSADLKTVREVFAGFEGVTNIRFGEVSFLVSCSFFPLIQCFSSYLRG